MSNNMFDTVKFMSKSIAQTLFWTVPQPMRCHILFDGPIQPDHSHMFLLMDKRKGGGCIFNDGFAYQVIFPYDNTLYRKLWSMNSSLNSLRPSGLFHPIGVEFLITGKRRFDWSSLIYYKVTSFWWLFRLNSSQFGKKSSQVKMISLQS